MRPTDQPADPPASAPAAPPGSGLDSEPDAVWEWVERAGRALAPVSTPDLVAAAVALAVLIAMLWLPGYLLLCWLFPLRSCRICRGTGIVRSPVLRVRRRCQNCQGSGAQWRRGLRLWTRRRRTIPAGAHYRGADDYTGGRDSHYADYDATISRSRRRDYQGPIASGPTTTSTTSAARPAEPKPEPEPGEADDKRDEREAGGDHHGDRDATGDCERPLTRDEKLRAIVADAPYPTRDKAIRRTLAATLPLSWPATELLRDTLSPFRRCRRCAATGVDRKPHLDRWRACRRCRATGIHLRWPWRLHRGANRALARWRSIRAPDLPTEHRSTAARPRAATTHTPDGLSALIASAASGSTELGDAVHETEDDAVRRLLADTPPPQRGHARELYHLLFRAMSALTPPATGPEADETRSGTGHGSADPSDRGDRDGADLPPPSPDATRPPRPPGRGIVSPTARESRASRAEPDRPPRSHPRPPSGRVIGAQPPTESADPARQED